MLVYEVQTKWIFEDRDEMEDGPLFTTEAAARHCMTRLGRPSYTEEMKKGAQSGELVLVPREVLERWEH